MKNLLRSAAAAIVACAAIVSPVHAQIANGNFATGNLTGWNSTGFTAVEQYTTSATSDGYYASFEISPPSGTYQAVAATDYLDPVAPDPVPEATIETFAELSSGSLGTLASPDTVDDGSAISQTFTASRNGQLSFEFNFVTNEIYAPVNNDFAFYSISTGSGATPIKLADTTNATLAVPGGLSAPYAAQTGYQKVSVLLNAGDYTLAFGAVNVNDPTVSSAILIDNVVFNPAPAPGALSVAASGSLLAAAALRRRIRAK